MTLPRRLVVAAALAAPAITSTLLAGTALAQSSDSRLGERAAGLAEAPVRVIEFFSLTCGHCAAFHKETYPRVKEDLLARGEVRLVWRDFPLDRLALTAAAVARSLPAERYEGFIGTLLANQDRWAFGREPLAALAQLAALAGMARPRFDEVAADEALARGILEQRALAEREFSIQATPSFSFQAAGRAPRNQSGNVTFERFLALVEEAKKA